MDRFLFYHFDPDKETDMRNMTRLSSVNQRGMEEEESVTGAARGAGTEGDSPGPETGLGTGKGEGDIFRLFMENLIPVCL